MIDSRLERLQSQGIYIDILFLASEFHLVECYPHHSRLHENLREYPVYYLQSTLCYYRLCRFPYHQPTKKMIIERFGPFNNGHSLLAVFPVHCSWNFSRLVPG